MGAVTLWGSAGGPQSSRPSAFEHLVDPLQRATSETLYLLAASALLVPQCPQESTIALSSGWKSEHRRPSRSSLIRTSFSLSPVFSSSWSWSVLHFNYSPASVGKAYTCTVYTASSRFFPPLSSKGSVFSSSLSLSLLLWCRRSLPDSDLEGQG